MARKDCPERCVHVKSARIEVVATESSAKMGPGRFGTWPKDFRLPPWRKWVLSSTAIFCSGDSSWTAWPLKKGPIGCPETSVTNYQSTLHITPGKAKISFPQRVCNLNGIGQSAFRLQTHSVTACCEDAHRLQTTDEPCNLMCTCCFPDDSNKRIITSQVCPVQYMKEITKSQFSVVLSWTCYIAVHLTDV
jgi:hypothetical protein